MIDEKKTEQGKVFFIIGMRRSGTSIVRRIIAAADGVAGILFEPHELYHAVQMMHFKRFRGPLHKKRIEDFKKQGDGEWMGAKFALNPGIDALDWKWLDKIFPEARFIFVFRNEADTFNSYATADKDSNRGVIPLHIYSPIFQWVQGCLWHFADGNPDRAYIVYYDKMIKAPTKELNPVWKLLDVKAPKGIKNLIRPPEKTEGGK